jgi:hypothetical protein
VGLLEVEVAVILEEKMHEEQHGRQRANRVVAVTLRQSPEDRGRELQRSDKQEGAARRRHRFVAEVGTREHEKGVREHENVDVYRVQQRTEEHQRKNNDRRQLVADGESPEHEFSNGVGVLGGAPYQFPQQGIVDLKMGDGERKGREGGGGDWITWAIVLSTLSDGSLT